MFKSFEDFLGTLLIIVSTLTTSLNIYPVNIFLGFLGNIFYMIYLVRFKLYGSMLLMNIIFSMMFLFGIIKYFWS